MADQSELLRRQQALAKFGDFVLDHEDLDDILNEGCRLIAQALGADLAKVIEIDRDDQTGLVRAGIGWRPGIVGRERLSLSEGTSEAYAIKMAEPVITKDLAEETRFAFPPFLLEHRVVALINVPIFLPGRRPWGLLQVDAQEPREFDEADIAFLKTYAMVLGPVIDRLRTIVERKQAETYQGVLLAELQHRVRNVLALVRSIVRRTAETAESAAEVGMLLDGRISSLARTQAMLTRGAASTVSLELMVHEELLAQQARDSHVIVEGPAVELTPKAAEVLTLALHELATNATKYGAFAQASGRLAVRWTSEPMENGRDRLCLTWRETGMQLPAEAGRRRGFGSDLIERRVPYELKGQGRIELRPEGLYAEIAFPLDPGESVLATGPPSVSRQVVEEHDEL